MHKYTNLHTFIQNNAYVNNLLYSYAGGAEL